MDMSVDIEATGIDQATNNTSEVRHGRDGWREADQSVTDARQIERVESSKKRGWGEMDGEAWDWEREVEEWDNERGRKEEVVEEWEEEVEGEGRCECEGVTM